MGWGRIQGPMTDDQGFTWCICVVGNATIEFRVRAIQFRVASELMVPLISLDMVDIADREYLSSRIVHCFVHGKIKDILPKPYFFVLKRNSISETIQKPLNGLDLNRSLGRCFFLNH